MCAEKTSEDYKISREDQDVYALASYTRAAAATADGRLKREMMEVTIKGKKGDTVLSEDEEVKKLQADKVPTLKTVFKVGRK